MQGHDADLIATIALGLSAAFVGGFVARRLRIPVIVGYLLAGIAVGPFTPGVVANPDIALELAEIGVILLMFGVGLHFSVADLWRVRSVAIVGAAVQISVATGLGVLVGVIAGWPLEAAVVLGLAISVASTVVLLRTLERRGWLTSPAGQVAVGWLIVEDIFTVVVLVVLPSIAAAAGDGPEVVSPGGVAAEMAIALGKAGILSVIILVFGARFLPWVLLRVERQGSRELFTLATLAISIGLAFGASSIFDVSPALGAFLAGAVLSGSPLKERVAQEVLPLTDTFGVLFFVAVGMLLDPAILIRMPFAVLTVLGVVIVGKSLAALAIVAILGRPVRIGLTVAAGLAQVGEFSFIVATVARTLGLLPDEAFQLVAAAALLSITVNPFLFMAVEPLERWIGSHPRLASILDRRAVPADDDAVVSAAR
jgi:CPA2 family monovalent cation:H+ antiporter-2